MLNQDKTLQLPMGMPSLVQHPSNSTPSNLAADIMNRSLSASGRARSLSISGRGGGVVLHPPTAINQYNQLSNPNLDPFLDRLFQPSAQQQMQAMNTSGRHQFRKTELEFMKKGSSTASSRSNQQMGSVKKSSFPLPALRKNAGKATKRGTFLQSYRTLWSKDMSHSPRTRKELFWLRMNAKNKIR